MTLTLKSPLDMHLHLRDGDMLKVVAPLTSKSFVTAIIMPNLLPPITSKEALLAYKNRIKEACKDDIFEPLMTLFFQETYTKEFLEDIKESLGAIKLFPSGITTNSENGVSEINCEQLAPVLNIMSELNIPLCVHGETNGFVMDREKEFCPIYEDLAKNFPNLKIIMEHITTKEAAKLVEKYENLYATITLHHLYFTLDDVIGGMMKPHHFCKPIAKRPEDRDALLNLALNAHPKVMFGSDSAPHPISKKENGNGAAGIFSAPIALAALVELFESKGKLENLQAFVSDNACKIYDFTPPFKELTLVKKEMCVPAFYGDVKPMFAEETLQWSIK